MCAIRKRSKNIVCHGTGKTEVERTEGCVEEFLRQGANVYEARVSWHQRRI